MKIIGKTAEGLLLSASKLELAHFCGFYYDGIQGCPQFNPGEEITVSKMYEQLRVLKQNEGELQQMAAKLRLVADLLQVNDPVVNKLVTEPKQESVSA